MSDINGVIFYEGPSVIDGQPIVAIATFKTTNEKTGNLIQTWIMRSDLHPVDAINGGQDASVCGGCLLRGRIAPASERTKKGDFKGDTTNKERSCYVLVQNAPAGIWVSYKDGGYPVLAEEHRKLFRGKGLRHGAYGDPVAVPQSAWDNIMSYVRGKSRPGYTHQWKENRFAGWASQLMASTHNLAENAMAHAMGWRTFRTIGSVAELAPDEILCPASEEAGFTTDCEHCGACNGCRGPEDQRRNVAIVAHGSGGKADRVVKIGLVQLDLLKKAS